MLPGVQSGPMTAYKNRRNDVPPGTEVRRYLSLHAAVRTVRDRKLRLTLVDHLRQKYDPFEGSVPVAEANNRVVIFGGHYAQRAMWQQVAPHFTMEVKLIQTQDPWERVGRLNRAKILSTHVGCWTYGHESEFMWRLYCGDDGMRGRGVALQTTLEKLEVSVQRYDLAVSPVHYRYYHEVDPRGFDDGLDQFFHKRMGFAHENEVRLVKANEDHFNRLIAPDPRTGYVPEPSPGGMPDHLHLGDWDPAVIEQITISPYGDDAYDADVRDAMARAGSAIPVERSVLDPRRYRVQH
jgi:hypothetical protein